MQRARGHAVVPRSGGRRCSPRAGARLRLANSTPSARCRSPATSRADPQPAVARPDRAAPSPCRPEPAERAAGGRARAARGPRPRPRSRATQPWLATRVRASSIDSSREAARADANVRSRFAPSRAAPDLDRGGPERPRSRARRGSRRGGPRARAAGGRRRGGGRAPAGPPRRASAATGSRRAVRTARGAAGLSDGTAPGARNSTRGSPCPRRARPLPRPASAATPGRCSGPGHAARRPMLGSRRARGAPRARGARRPRGHGCRLAPAAAPRQGLGHRERGDTKPAATANAAVPVTSAAGSLAAAAVGGERGQHSEAERAADLLGRVDQAGGEPASSGAARTSRASSAPGKQARRRRRAGASPAVGR